MNQIIYLILAYLLGAVPTGLTLTKIQGIDITKIGSGNVGATNVARALGKKFGIITLLVDILKGALAVLIAKLIGFETAIIYLSALVAVLGHCFSIPKLLTGGKGVATAFGAVIALSPLVAAGALAVFILVYKITKIVSLGSLLACASLPLLAWPLVDSQLAINLLIIAAVIIYKHRSNISNLLAGKEKQFAAKS